MEDNISCENLTCPLNKDGKCKNLTYSEMMNNRLTCGERKY